MQQDEIIMNSYLLALLKGVLREAVEDTEL